MELASRLLLAAIATLALGGCELIGDIFRAGVWTGVIIVVVVIAAIVWGASRLFK
jgi:hypothetical protein